VLRAFIEGCWLVYWTDDTLYWAAKPTVQVDRSNGNRRLHNASHAALESDVENLYFLNGVLVPAFVVVKPEWITLDHIIRESNAEVRRAMIERMGWDRFCELAQMKLIHVDELHSNFPSIPVSESVAPGARLVTGYRGGAERAELLEADGVLDFGDRPLRFVRLTDPSIGRQYVIRVRHDHARCYEAVGWTFGMSETNYKRGKYLRQGDVMLKPLSGGPLAQQHS
jgi:hypothetical protein